MNIKYKYALKETVIVKALGITGNISSVLTDLANGSQYRVVYWAKSERQELWLFEWEIEQGGKL